MAEGHALIRIGRSGAVAGSDGELKVPTLSRKEREKWGTRHLLDAGGVS